LSDIGLPLIKILQTRLSAGRLFTILCHPVAHVKAVERSQAVFS